VSFVSPYLRLRYRHVPKLLFVALVLGVMNYFLYFHSTWFEPLVDRISCRVYEPCLVAPLPVQEPGPIMGPNEFSTPVPAEPVPQITVLYVQANNAILHNMAKPPKDGTSRLRQFQKCQSLIQFGRVEAWIEVGEVEPQGWMHESLLAQEKPEGCE